MQINNLGGIKYQQFCNLVKKMESLQYPIGKYTFPDNPGQDWINHCIQEISILPETMMEAVNNLSHEQLLTPYRPNGWYVLQVVHHCADSHMNAFVRFKLTLTQDAPTINPYLEASWAEMPDVLNASVDLSLNLLDGLHKRWVILLKSLNEGQWNRRYIHPQYNKQFTLKEALGLYAWHGKHHLAHIVNLKKRENW